LTREGPRDYSRAIMTEGSSPQATTRRRAGVLLALVIAIPCAVINLSARAEFVLGGALVNLGYRLQDPLDQFDFSHGHDVQPAAIWDEALRQNHLAARCARASPARRTTR
jgi:hypothetical protein